MSAADHLACRASGWNIHRAGLSGTSAPVEHVLTRCPALIATLVAMAEAAKYDRELDAESGRARPLDIKVSRCAPQAGG